MCCDPMKRIVIDGLFTVILRQFCTLGLWKVEAEQRVASSGVFYLPLPREEKFLLGCQKWHQPLWQGGQELTFGLLV